MKDMRELFPFFEHNKNITYLDNANTTQILGSCLSSYIKYYYNFNYNIGRASYTGARMAQQIKDWALASAGKFLGTEASNIIFTSGATEGLNLVAYSICNTLKQEHKRATLLTTELEHASAILPWMAFGKNVIDIQFIKMTDDYCLTVDNLKAAISKYKPDILLLASMTNTTSEVRPLKEIGKVAKEHDIIFVVDHAQGAAHVPISVDEYNIDYLSCSLHKMYGPKGLGILYARHPETLRPMRLGGGMNQWFEKDGTFEIQEGNERFAAGTEDVPVYCAAMEAIDFVMSNWEQIKIHDVYLGTFAYGLLSRVPGVEIYSKKGSPIVLFNVKDKEALDVMEQLDNDNIYIRAGNHCSKLTKDLFGLSTCRVSLGIYNTEEDLMRLYKALKGEPLEKMNEEKREL